ncbi:MAG: rRNA maturation RNase YbeY [Casimicrobiaceae bacterium]
MRTSAIRPGPSRTRSAGQPALRLAIQNGTGATDLPAHSTIRRWLSHALRRPAELTVRFVGLAEGRRLNRTFRGRDYATNVLSFAYGDDALGSPPDLRAAAAMPVPVIAGDIVLCVPVLRREARVQAKTLRAHCAHLLIHGALHLCGYDHETDKDAKVMEALETGLLDSLGYDDPYAAIRGNGVRVR